MERCKTFEILHKVGRDIPVSYTHLQAADEHDFSVLPAGMRDAAEEAMSVLRETGDGQLCDIIIDKAALNAILQAGKASGDPLLAFYAEHTVATANIKTAVRCQKTGKSLDFIRRALRCV